MPNAGYPDDDGSRDPQGQHDEGRQRVSCFRAESIAKPQDVAEMQAGDRINGNTDSLGDRETPYYGPVDGDANTTPGRALAAYPSYVSAD